MVHCSRSTKLNFNKDGLFKIAQFTDVHYVPEIQIGYGLVGYSARIGYGKARYGYFHRGYCNRKTDKNRMGHRYKLVVDRKIPFAVALGNHDDESGTTRLELEKIITDYPYNCNYPPVDS